MKTAFFTLLLLALAGKASIAQEHLPVVRANSPIADIRDGGVLEKGTWRIVPAEKLDVYKTSSKHVSFYTDVDSISVAVNPGTPVDFVILLNGTDSARTRIEYQPSRLDMLKSAAQYDPSDRRTVPAFSYQPAADPALRNVRERLKLDSIAGKGNELSKIFNLLHWVHNEIRHNGSSDNPALKNAIDLIRVCKAENRGANCRMLATVLNECYLAMGIPSRYVTCMPKESQFDDCHVINMVYSRDLDKWIWIDPTFDAYVMDENGNLMGIQEVRERLIRDQPLILNADANWNRESLQTKAGYLKTYMAKNLYRLQSPVVSEHDTETAKKGKTVAYVELLPLDAPVQQPQQQESPNRGTGSKITYYKTNNPDLFWARPE